MSQGARAVPVLQPSQAAPIEGISQHVPARGVLPKRPWLLWKGRSPTLRLLSALCTWAKAGRTRTRSAAACQGQGVVVPPASQGSPWWGWGHGPKVAGAAWEPQARAAPPHQPAIPEASARQGQMQGIPAPSQALQEPGRSSALPSGLLLDELLASPEFLQKRSFSVS